MSDAKLPQDPPIAGMIDEDILELTEALAEDGTVRRLEPRLSRPEPPRLDAAKSGRGEPGAERIVSPATAQSAAAALGRIGGTPRPGGAVPGLAVGAAGPTLEDLVRDALRPLLQGWLDEHLPALVERLVREEIARLAGGARHS